MGKLLTHVPDITSGRPAAGVGIELHAIEPAGRRLRRRVVTRSGGRRDAPLLVSPWAYSTCRGS